uniref:Uncharacterized protein n=1 Tax=Astyanax mexicanus TaxID=7994 RepID=A0A8B9R5X6_ASTMX
MFLSPSELNSLSWDDLESNLPDELIPNGPNGDLGLMSMPTNGGTGTGGLVPDAAAKHKQLSELLRAGSSTNLSAGLNSASPTPGGMGAQLGALGKSPLSQGSPSHPSQTQKPGGAAGTQGNPAGAGGMGLNAGFNQAMLNNAQTHGMMGQNAGAQQGQVINGTLGPAGRGRGAAGMQYQNPAMQGAVLAETLTQGAQQMGMNAQQAGNMNKVSKKFWLNFFYACVNLNQTEKENAPAKQTQLIRTEETTTGVKTAEILLGFLEIYTVVKWKFCKDGC